MGTSSAAEEKWEHSVYGSQQEEDREEALSLCDFLENMTKEGNNQSSKNQEAHQGTERNEEDFDFGPWCGEASFSDKSELCAADDVFFRGQLLPLRLSVSSENGINKLRNESSLNPSHFLARSESIDRKSLGGFTSFSSRSSSSRSHYSSSSTTSAAASTRTIKPIIQNQFLTHPSPKPHIRFSSATSLGNIAASNRPRNSSVWDLFRLGLVRTPEIEFQDLKVRNSVSRNSSSGSSNSNSSIKNSSKTVTAARDRSNRSISGSKIRNVRRNSSDVRDKIESNDQNGNSMEKGRKQSLLENRNRGGLLSGCSCSVTAVKPIPPNVVVTRSSSSGRKAGNAINNGKSERGSVEEKLRLRESKMKKRMAQKQQQEKQAMSCHRTFEWIKKL